MIGARMLAIWGIAMVAASPTAALAAAGEVAIGEAGAEAPSRVCLNVRQIKGFDAFSDEHLYVTAANRRSFLFVMRPGCMGLKQSFGIAVANTMATLCSDSMGTVTYRDVSRRPAECRIADIIEVESKEHARMLATGN